MRLNFYSRTWHIWVSVSLCLPILVVAVTAALLAHKRSLGTEEIGVAAGWLPGYRAAATTTRLDARASLAAADGDLYVAPPSGLYRVRGDRLEAVEEFAGTQVRGLAEAAWGRVAAAKSGIWLERDGHWQRVHRGDAWNADARPDGTVAVALREQGLLVSGDGRRWEPDARIAGMLSALPTAVSEPLSLARLTMDLHTGRAIFGKDGEWVWVDLVAGALGTLVLTGLYLWRQRQRRKPARNKA